MHWGVGGCEGPGVNYVSDFPRTKLLMV